ncbi:MAG TPA: YbjQ family protein [Candidatus Nanoarchaeia archaeon]|nr:YbjQ family protein [Candidatus Nanoarchaeia archaeon]
MIVTTGCEVPGKKVSKVLGVVKGNTVRSRNLGVDIIAGIKNMIGGEITVYTTLVTQAREEAYERMVQKAKELNADAIVNMKFMTSTVMAGASEMLAYGTAVKLK